MSTGLGRAGEAVAILRYVLFDFFGTLVDYDPSVHPRPNAPLAFARHAGVYISEQDSDQFWQLAWRDLEAEADESGREFSMNQVVQRYWHHIGSPPLPLEDFDALIAAYLAAWTQNVSRADGALECLADLALDYTLAIVSNTHDSALVPRLAQRLGLDANINFIVASVDVGWRKPHRAIFDAVLNHFGADPSQAIFIGDNWEADVVGPRRMGMSAVFVGQSTSGRTGVALADLPAAVRARNRLA